MKGNFTKGFTLIEVAIVIGITAILASVVTLNLIGKKNSEALQNTTTDVGTLLRQAQSDAMAGESGASWGVHFDNRISTSPFYELFYTNSTYASGTVTSHYALPSGLCYAGGVPSGGTLDIIFNQVSGIPSTSTIITLESYQGSCAAAGGQSGVSRISSGM